MRLSLMLALLVAVVLGVALVVDLSAVSRWASEAQRGFQNHMARAIQALRAGEVAALAALFGGAAAYGFVHALGPGHGKYLIGGVGLGTSVPLGRLMGLALASSLAQALWAIVLVYGGFFALQLSAQRMTALAEDVFAPASYAAIALVGGILVWRGARALAPRRAVAGHGHDHDGGCGHAHGPTPEEAARVGSLREAIGLIASIAVRPCTGAIFLLVIAWQMQIKLAGAAAVLVMGLGTAALTGLVAVSSVAARGLAFASAGRGRGLPLAMAAAQILGGGLILAISLTLLRGAVT